MSGAAAAGGLIGAIGGVANTIGGTIYQAKQAQQQANKARNFQREVLQNSVRWKVADLRAAGLNPILAATGGGLGGSSAPGGVVAQVPNFGGIGSAAAEGYRSGTAGGKDIEEAGRARNQSRAAETQADLNRAAVQATQARASRDRAGAMTEYAHQDLMRQQTEAASAQARQMSSNADLLDFAKHRAAGEAQLWSNPYMMRIMQMRAVLGGAYQPPPGGTGQPRYRVPEGFSPAPKPKTFGRKKGFK